MDEKIYKLIEALGDDAKTAFIVYLALDYGSLMIFIGLVAWGIRTVWRNRNDWKDDG